MPAFAFWNLYRLGAGSHVNKKTIVEAVLAQIFKEYEPECAFLCEVTSEVNLGDAYVGGLLCRATRTKGQLSYAGINVEDLEARDLVSAEIGDFQDVFGRPQFRKGGSNFSKQSKRPVAYGGQVGDVPVYIYHANASRKASFLTAWVAESLDIAHDEKFVLAGDLNCQPEEFQNMMDYCLDIAHTRTGGYWQQHFNCCHDGYTHNANDQLTRIYDWAITGKKVLGIKVTAINYNNEFNQMGMTGATSDHLPIVVSWQ